MAESYSIKNFVASMSKAGGFARTARYAVRIHPPALLRVLNDREGQAILRDGVTAEPSDAKNLLNMHSIARQVGQQVNLHCDSISMPGHDLQSQSVQHGSAPARDMVQSHDYAGNISASFYLDSHLRERHFFEMWMKMAVNIYTHKANYYDDYIGSMEIFQLDARNRVTYAIKATEIYPATIGGIEYSYANSNQIAKMNVGFAYRQWYNLTSDAIAGIVERKEVVGRNETFIGYSTEEVKTIKTKTTGYQR